MNTPRIDEKTTEDFTYSYFDEIAYVLLCTVRQVYKYYDQYTNKNTLAQIMKGMWMWQYIREKKFYFDETIEKNADINYNTIILSADWILKQKQKPKALMINYATFFGYYYNKSDYTEEHEPFTHLVILNSVMNEMKYFESMETDETEETDKSKVRKKCKNKNIKSIEK